MTPIDAQKLNLSCHSELIKNQDRYIIHKEQKPLAIMVKFK